MNIALVVADDVSAYLFCKGIICNLTKMNHKVFCICSVSHFKQELLNMNVTLISVKTPRTFSPIRDLFYLARLISALKKNNIECVINIIAAKQNIYGSFAAYICKINKIFSWVNGLGQVFNKNKKNYFLKKIVLNLYKLAFSINKMVWFNNKYDLKYFLSKQIIIKKKTFLTNFFLDVDYYCAKAVTFKQQKYACKKINIKKSEQIVIMVARLIKEKGILEFCIAAEILFKQNPKIKFLLIAPEEPGHINSIPKKFILSVEKKCNFIWLQFEKDVRPFYLISDLAVLPSFYNEGGFPRAIIEPMAFAKPIITTNTHGCRQTVDNGKNGFLVEPQNAKNLAFLIKKILKNSRLRNKMGLYSKRKVFCEFNEHNIVPKDLSKYGISLNK